MRTAPLAIALVLAACRTAPLTNPLSNDGAAAVTDAGCDAGGLESPPTPGTIACGARACSVGNEQCCVNANPPFDRSCSPMGCTSNQVEFICDGPEDCAVGICCMPIQNSLGTSRCSRDCIGGLELCHNSADCGAGRLCAMEPSFPDGTGTCAQATCP
jgi:hypothetical protein